MPASPLARAARALALAALPGLGVPKARLRLLLDGYNTTFRVDTAAGERFALRVVRPAVDEAALGAEIAWTRAAAADTGLRLAAPVAWTRVPDAAPSGPRHVLLMRWVHGAQRGPGLSPRMLEEVGAAAALLHAQARAWGPAHPDWARPRLDSVWLDGDPPPGTLPADFEALLRTAERRLEHLLTDLFRTEQPIPLHADLHQGNYRFARGHDIGILDFDDCAWGLPRQDLAITIYYLQKLKRCDELVAGLRRGYERHAPWPLDPDLLQALLVWRTLGLCGAVLRHPSPNLQALVPQLLPTWRARLQAWLG